MPVGKAQKEVLVAGAGEDRQTKRSSLEEESELRHFLKLARPEWSHPRRSGRTDFVLVIDKLKAIGVGDTATLVDRIDRNVLNEELAANGFLRLSREAVDGIRKQSARIRALEFMDVPHVRQIGPFSPMSQMLSMKRQINTERLKAPMSTSANSNIAERTVPIPRATSAPDLAMLDEDALDMDPALYGGLEGERLVVRLRGQQSGKKRQRPPIKVRSGEEDALALSRELEGDSMPSGETPKSAKHAWVVAKAAVSLLSPSSRGKCATDSETQSTADRSKSTNASSSNQTPGSSQTPSRSTTFSSKGRSKGSGGVGFGDCVDDATPNMRPRVKSDAWEDRTGGISMAEVAKLCNAGAEMRNSDLKARWSCSRYKSPHQQGIEMIQEHEHLEERNRLSRELRCFDHPSPMRSHITNNIKCRLKEEAPHATQVLNVQQQCMNIRKHLASMTNQRRELAGLSKSFQAPDDEDRKDGIQQLSLGFGKPSAEAGALHAHEADAAVALAEPVFGSMLAAQRRMSGGRGSVSTPHLNR
jgi:hypothetical protein